MDEVVLVHGLWFRVHFMHMLAWRLATAGFTVHGFNYRTTRETLEASAARLHRFCRQRAPRGAHLVGHSLGGLLILQMMVDSDWDAPGRLLFLGTPLRGSAVARRVGSWPGAERLLGHAEGPLGDGHRGWPANREAGMIAGTSSFGVGLFTGGLERPNDGTVAVAETEHPGLTCRIELPVTHTGLLFSKQVARRASEFLRSGRFAGYG